MFSRFKSAVIEFKKALVVKPTRLKESCHRSQRKTYYLLGPLRIAPTPSTVKKSSKSSQKLG